MNDENAAEPMEIDSPKDDPNSLEALRPIAILIDELSQEDIQIRIGALKQVTRIASALGPERTRTELIPYLTDMLDDDDEVLRIICEVLLQLLELVGGKEYFHTLIPPYETLCVVEENSIRTLALTKLSEIITQLPDQAALQHLPSLFERLFSSGWHTARTAAAGMAPSIYPRVCNSEHGSSLQHNFLKLAKDSMPQVRRAVAENVGSLMKILPRAQAEELVFPTLLELTSDDQDSVRVRGLQSLIDVSLLIEEEANVNKLRWSIRRLCTDTSWRVRFLAASKFNQICASLEKESQSMLDIYVKLLKDVEAEVRAAASSQLPEICSKWITEDVMKSKFVSILKNLSKDENKYARAQFAEVVVAAGSRYSSEFVGSHILPSVLDLLKDPEPEPRLKCLSNLDLDVVNAMDLLEALMPCITQLAEDDKWRIRQSVMAMLPNLSSRLGTQIVDERIKTLMFKLMEDQVNKVRETAAQTMLKICQQLNDQEWTEKTAAEIFEKSKGQNYLRKQTALECIQHMIDILPTQKCIELLLKFAEDKVPNVRFKLCTIMRNLIQCRKVPQEQYPIILETLKKLYTDSDPDVRYFSQQTCGLLVPGSIGH